MFLKITISFAKDISILENAFETMQKQGFGVEEKQ